MDIQPTTLPGVFLLVPRFIEDERGFFARVWCEETLTRAGLCGRWVQSSIAFNHRKGTLRGMHYQADPAPEIKLVRCTQGAIHDVLVDLRPTSPTYLKWQAFDLSDENRATLYVPGGIAHGYQTTTDNAEVLYLMSEPYQPGLQRGARWNDPALKIHWPECAARIISARDQSFADVQS